MKAKKLQATKDDIYIFRGKALWKNKYHVTVFLQINPGVALQLLKLCPIPKGQYLLQNAAGSVVGRILIALANFYGFKTISVVRRPAAKQQLLALG